MKTVYKYQVPIDGTIKLPLGATVLHVGEQAQSVCLWALVDTNQPLVGRRFMLVGTGHPIPETATYHGTGHIMIGGLVFHVFEIPQ